MHSLRGVIAATILAVNTIGWVLWLILITAVGYLIPGKASRKYFDELRDGVIDGWVGVNRLSMRVLQQCKIELTGDIEELSRKESYMVISNHQSWVDIILLQVTLREQAPVLKFFTKQQLIWIPLIGIAMWMLDFPYVKRLNKRALKKNPQLRNSDRENTLAACEKFKKRPVAILNFLEGTRFTPEKHASRPSRFTHLLNPKLGGLGYILAGMQNNLAALVDISIVYPNGIPTFWDFYCGRVPVVQMKVNKLKIPDEFLDETITPEERNRMRDWIEERWQLKDVLLEAARNPTSTAAE